VADNLAGFTPEAFLARGRRGDAGRRSGQGAAALGPHGAVCLAQQGNRAVGFDPRGNQGLAQAYAVHPLGPRYDAVEHDIDFDPVAGTELFIANARVQGCPPEGLPMAALADRKVELVANLMRLWSGYDAIGSGCVCSPRRRPATWTRSPPPSSSPPH
jgi:aldehyde:ferredoxin oxidoreductase